MIPASLLPWLKGPPEDSLRSIQQVVRDYRILLDKLAENPKLDGYLLETAEANLPRLQEIVEGGWPGVDHVLAETQSGETTLEDAATQIRAIIADCVGEAMLATACIHDAGAALTAPDLAAGRRLKGSDKADRIVASFLALRRQYPDENKHSNWWLSGQVGTRVGCSQAYAWQVLQKRRNLTGRPGRRKKR
jgi:hypothetical protein